MGDVMRIPMMRRLCYAQTISAFGDFLALFAILTSQVLRSAEDGSAPAGRSD
jgi:hypothetical protein